MQKGTLNKNTYALWLGMVMLVSPLLTFAALPMPADTSLVYRVKGLDAGNVLKMYK